MIFTSRLRTVYNLEVEGLHDYFVGDDGVLVHNTVCFKPFTRGNFRHNLGLLIPRPPGSHAHHIIPHEFQRLFPDRVLDNPLENGAWVPGGPHISEITAQWNRWEHANPNATAADVLAFSRAIEQRFGHLFIRPN